MKNSVLRFYIRCSSKKEGYEKIFKKINNFSIDRQYSLVVEMVDVDSQSINT